ncbi:DUF2167 domain-containing protein [Massilia sp. PAMC28688]|nr:DUF2167 domain-containing protein [Massilia sp. PAMC28688]
MATVLALSCICSAQAQEQGAQKITPEQFEASLNYQTGKITLPGSLATLNLPANFRYLNPADSERVLVEGWGNPPGNETLGMIVPADTSLLSAAGWGVVVTYEKDGHVKDDDADDINYDELLTEMKSGMEEANKERKAQGYGAMTLVGWAEKPSYDKASHKMYWAKELRTEGDTASGLNYNIRVLGREGVLVLNAVANMAQIDVIRKEMKHVTAATDFTAGNRYADYNAATDKTAEYGLAALVAGGVATKLGLFGKLFALVLAFKKFIIIGIGFAGMWLYRVFAGRREAKVNLEK